MRSHFNFTQSSGIGIFSCLAISRQGGLPSKTAKTEGPFGIGRKVIVCESLLSAAAVCAFERFTNNEQKAVTDTARIVFIIFSFYKILSTTLIYVRSCARCNSMQRSLSSNVDRRLASGAGHRSVLKRKLFGLFYCHATDKLLPGVLKLC